jgi:UDP-2,3-diacylglucosamine pyrophosphatase LpxH
MTGLNAVPCEQCLKVLHEHDALEYLYCGHQHVVAFRLADGAVEYIPVGSTEEAIALVLEAGQAALPLKVPA